MAVCPDTEMSNQEVAEADGNRTRQGSCRPLTGFEDRGTHQASGRLLGSIVPEVRGFASRDDRFHIRNPAPEVPGFTGCFGNLEGGIYALMNMPERSFGRTVRYRRTKLGMSQAKLADLVGRSTPTIRAWERDKSRPNDPKVLSALAAVLGLDERHLFDKAGVEQPKSETSPTVEQALATLSFDDVVDASNSDNETDGAEGHSGEGEPQIPVERRDETVGASREPAYVAPPDPIERVPLTPTTADLSYMEDDSQRQLYRVRNLATMVALVALAIGFIWALGEGLGALGEWWDDFFANLRL